MDILFVIVMEIPFVHSLDQFIIHHNIQLILRHIQVLFVPEMPKIAYVPGIVGNNTESLLVKVVIQMLLHLLQVVQPKILMLSKIVTLTTKAHLAVLGLFIRVI